MLARAVILTGILGLAAAAQVEERVVVATNVVCRAEPGASATPVGSLDLAERMRVVRRRLLEPDSAEWLHVDSPRRYGPCWVSASLTAPYDPSRPEGALLAVADYILETRDGRPFEDFVSAENLFLAPPYGVDVNASPELSLRRLQLVAAALSTYEPWNARSRPLQHAWQLAHRSEILYNEPGGQWVVDRERYWELHDRFRDTVWADELAWSAATSAPISECEGSVDCQLERVIGGVGEYWSRYPAGRFLADALGAASERLEVIATDLCVADLMWHPVTDSMLARTRESLRAVTDDAKRDLLRALDQVELRCSPPQAADGVPLLSVEAFRDVPPHVTERLREVDCLIPQAFHSDRPHSLIKGRFAAADQEDWAALCKMGAWSGIVVVWGGPVRCPDPIAVGLDRGLFQGIGEGEVGYSRAIGTATMEYILKLAEYFEAPEPPSRDHDGIDDAFVDKASVIHYCHEGRWYRLQGMD